MRINYRDAIIVTGVGVFVTTALSLGGVPPAGQLMVAMLCGVLMGLSGKFNILIFDKEDE